MEQLKRNVVGQAIRRVRVAKDMSQQQLASRCALLGYDLRRPTLAKIEAEIRGVSDTELFVISRALRVQLSELYPSNLLKKIRDGEIAPFHVRKPNERN